MCGIAGFIGSTTAESSRAVMARMITALERRGPDGRDFTAINLGDGRQLTFGHARLSILDLTHCAAQPMRDAATDSWLIYNGEIYNFAALRRELQGLGHAFKSTGDTEVLLKALVQWSANAMLRLRGMYAFAFWDGRKRELLLGRDPFGIKPLLLAHVGDTIVFASEVRAIAAARLIALNINPAAIRSYLTYGCVVEPATIYREIASVPPGHVLIADAFGRLIPPRRILTLADVLDRDGQPDKSMSYHVAVETIRTQLQRTVSDHLVSDVPVGVFLSGGIDSSVVAAMADRTGIARELRYLTICFAEQEFSELGYAKEVARRLSGRHDTVLLDAAQMTTLMPQALGCMDQPSVDGINTFMVSKVAREQGIKVVLSGLGGDELFGGYTTFWKAPLLGRFPKALGLLGALVPARAFSSENERQKLLYAQKCSNVHEAYLLQRSIRWDAKLSGIKRLGSLMDNAFACEGEGQLATETRLESYRRISYYESTFYMRNQLLRDSDIMSAANSIELRVPFLDLDLLAAVWRIPGRHHRSTFGAGKRILKDVLNQAIPGLALNRRKMGFVFPWKHWLRDPKFFAMIADTINTPSLYDGTETDPAEGRQIIAAFQKPESVINWAQVWSLFILLDWKMRNVAA